MDPLPLLQLHGEFARSSGGAVCNGKNTLCAEEIPGSLVEEFKMTETERQEFLQGLNAGVCARTINFYA